MKKIKRILCAVVAFFLVGANFGGIISVNAIDGDGPTVKNDPNGPTIMDDGVRLHKTARAVPGFANEWEVTLKIEAPPVTATSDTVIIIDRSNSMTDGMLTRAKAAATTLAQELLPEGNTVNRVAVLSFGTDVINKSNGFSDSFSTINSAINDTSTGIQPQGGGTFTQGAIHTAAQLFANSDATYKNIVLLSDGVPSFSYGIRNVSAGDFESGHSMIGGNTVRQFKVMTSNSKFNYSSTVGDGSRSIFEPEGREMWDYYDTVWISGSGYNAYYDHGNSAIAEANFFKNSNGTIHTIAYNAGTLGNSVLNQMASEGKAHTSTGGDLDGIFRDIAGQIKSLVGSTHVHDVMGEGVYIDSISHAEVLDWDPVFTFNNTTGMFEATRTYRVSANEHMLDENSTDGFHPLNKSATITYNGKTGNFPVPRAKPFFINVKKTLVGQQANGQIFNFEFTHPNGEKTTYQVEAGKTHRIIEPFPVGSYSISETGTSNNEIAFENYLTTYTVGEEVGASFQINEQHADHIDVMITNTYNTTNVGVEKKWDDDNNRDGQRSNYSDLFIAVKDGGKYVAYQALEGTDKEYSFTNLPEYRNGSLIGYTVVEARGCSGTGNSITCRSDFVGDNTYTVTNVDGVITNKHTPSTVTLTIKKKWDISAGTLPTLAPGFVTIEVSNDKNSNVETVTLEGESYAEWTGTFTGFENEGGQKINYTVAEKNIGSGVLNNDNTLYVYNGGILEGKWVATRSGTEVTNTWTPASSTYDGEASFKIKKTDAKGDALDGVVFTVDGEDYTTSNGGEIEVQAELSNNKAEERKTFTISEKSTLDGYDAVEGSAEIEMVCTSVFESANVTSLQNSYKKTCEFNKKSGSVDFNFNSNTGVLTVVNDRSVAKSLIIRKEISGVTSDALEKNNLTFTLSGPADFEEQEIAFADFEEIEDGVFEYEVDGFIPTGTYTVTESGAEFKGLLTLEASGDIDTEKEVESGDDVVFAVKNQYSEILDGSYSVMKIWDDVDDQDGKRPEVLKVNLLRDGKKYKTVELKDNGWSYEWTGLPVAGENAEPYVYTAEEEGVGAYESDGGKMVDGVFTFTNTHTPETIAISVNKNWDDEDNADGLRNDETVVTFCVTGYAGDYTSDTECKTVLTGISSSTDVVTFEALPKYHAGELLNYEVTEIDVLDGYTSNLVAGEYVTISDDNIGSIDVTNTHVVEPVEPCDDEEGCGGVEPEPEYEVVINTPETGKLTKGHSKGVTDSMWTSNLILGAIVLVLGSSISLVGKRIKK